VAIVDTRHVYFRVYDIYMPIALGVFGVILLTTLFLVVKNRRRAPEEASRRHTNERLEGGYAALLLCVVVFLLYVTYSAEHQTDTVANQEKPATTINVTASKWEWKFYYPAYHLTIFSGTTGQRTFWVPTGEAIRFTLTSADVIHAFWIPDLRFKHDLIHGRTQFQTLDFPAAGLFSGQCAEFCGLRHADMVYGIRAVSPKQFEAWGTHERGRTIR
jgi:cytochrome c oxidase subunit 2